MEEVQQIGSVEFMVVADLDKRILKG